MNDIALSSNLLDRTSSTIYVSNIRHSTPINSIFNIFSKYGPLERCEIPENKFGKTRGFAFIEFENKLNAYSAFEDLSKQEILLDGRVLKLEWARATKLYKEDIQNLSIESKEKIMGAFSRNHNFDSRYSKKGNNNNTRKISSKNINNNNNSNNNNSSNSNASNNSNNNTNNSAQSNNNSNNTSTISNNNNNNNNNNNTLAVNSNNSSKPISPSFTSSPSITTINTSPVSNPNNSNINSSNNNTNINNNSGNNFELNNSSSTPSAIQSAIPTPTATSTPTTTSNSTILSSSNNNIQQQQQQPQLTSPKKKTFIKKDQNETSPILTNSSNLYNNSFVQQTSPHNHHHHHNSSHHQLSQSQPHIPTTSTINGSLSPSQTSTSNIKKLNNSAVNLNANSPSYHQQQNGIGNHQFVSTNHHHSHHHHQHQTTNPLLPIPGLSKSLNGIGSTSYLDSNSIPPIIDHQINHQIPNYGAYFGIPNFNQSFDFGLSFNQTLNNFSNIDLHSRVILPTSDLNNTSIDNSSSGSSLIGNVSNSPSKMNSTLNSNTSINNNNTSPSSSSSSSSSSPSNVFHHLQPNNNNNNSVITSTNLISNSNGAIPTNGGSPNSSSPAINNGSNIPLMSSKLTVGTPSISNQALQSGFFNNNDEYLSELNASLHSLHNATLSSTCSSSSHYLNNNINNITNNNNNNIHHHHIHNNQQHYFASSQDPIIISTPPGINSFNHFSPISSFNNSFFK